MYYVGIDVGGMSVKCGFVAPTGKIVAKSTIVTDLSLGQEKLVSDIAEMIANTAKNARSKFSLSPVSQPSLLKAYITNSKSKE